MKNSLCLEAIQNIVSGEQDVREAHYERDVGRRGAGEISNRSGIPLEEKYRVCDVR